MPNQRSADKTFIGCYITLTLAKEFKAAARRLGLNHTEAISAALEAFAKTRKRSKRASTPCRFLCREPM
jgi:hypothetical protein